MLARARAWEGLRIHGFGCMPFGLMGGDGTASAGSGQMAFELWSEKKNWKHAVTWMKSRKLKKWRSAIHAYLREGSCGLARFCVPASGILGSCKCGELKALAGTIPWPWQGMRTGGLTKPPAAISR